jgi:hypothetical protein
MSQPVKLSDSLVEQRSIAGQIEFWAGLGRAVESLLRGREVLALMKMGAARPLSECLSMPESPEGRRRIADHFASLPYPHYETAPKRPGFLIRIEENGRRTLGRFVNRRFEPSRGSARA